jgi:hypothetical protein
MFHGTSPDAAVSARGPITIRYRDPLFVFLRASSLQSTPDNNELIIYLFLNTHHLKNLIVRLYYRVSSKNIPFQRRTPALFY